MAKVKAALGAIAVLVAIALVWCLRPIVKVRFGPLFVSRLGHLAGNTECYLCERDAGHALTLDLWIPEGEPANAYLFKMFRRVLTVAPWARVINIIGSRWQWWAEHQFSDAQWGRDIHNLMETQPPHLKFTRAEMRRGERGLRAMGIPEGAKWVCLFARDSYYLRMKEPGNDYSYHDFRDSNIQNYREAAMALMEKGYYVLRMGRHVAERMKLQGPLFLDYAMSEYRSDFMDIYLGAHCAFTISNGGGFDSLPMIFRRPICFVNETPFEYLSTWIPNSLAIWKHHVKDGERMTVAEIVASGAGLFHRAEQYAEAGITLEENSPQEIKDAALEMLTPWHESQDTFWATFPRSNSPHNGIALHGKIRLRIGAKFLEGYAN